MKVITKYEAEDGQIFDTEKECLVHEQTINKFVVSVQFVKECCERYCGDTCSDACPFATNNDNWGNTECALYECPCNWTIPSE